MNIFFGKISQKFDTVQLVEGYYIAPEGSTWFGELQPNDYVFMIGGNKVQFWQARAWGDKNGSYCMYFDILNADLGINVSQLIVLKFLLITKSLAILTSRSARNKAFFKLELIKDIPITDLSNTQFYKNAELYRTIRIIKREEVLENSEDIQLVYENEKLELIDNSFIDESIKNDFIDNLDKKGKGARMKDNVLEFFSKAVNDLPTTITYKKIGFRSFYDSFFCEYKLNEKYYVVGAYWDTYNPQDQTERFVKESIWLNGYTDKFIDDVNAVQVGSNIAIKAAFVREKTKPVMSIKARGIVTNNMLDGQTLEVEWEEDFHPFEVNFGGYMQTIKEVKKKAHIEAIWNQNDENTTTEYQSLNNNSSENMDFSLNHILYGPPGTGKTHKMKHNYLPTFVQSQRKISKEEFIVNHVSKLTWWKVIALTLFFENKAMTVPEIKAHHFIKIKLNVSNSVSLDQTIWGQLSQHTIKESETVDYTKRTFPLIFNKNEQSVWSLERTELIQDICELGNKIKSYVDISETKNNYDFITFHQSYAYEDFIEGIKPNLEESNQDTAEVNYIMKDGIFYKCCDEAAKLAGFSSLSDCIINFTREERIEKFSNAAPYALFIDEINRGNVSAIFGELITLIESEKRLTKDEIIVQLPYSNRYFSVPPNLYIIGTMNTADRSIESLDTALRRRFCFEEILPETDLLTPSAIYCNLLWEYENTKWNDEPFISAENNLFDLLGVPQSLYDERKLIWDKMETEKTPDKLTYFDIYNEDFTGVNLKKLLNIINDRIEILLDRDHTIGHSYFMKIKSIDDLKNTFKSNIIPLLQEYFYGDYEKIGLILGKGFFEQTKKIDKSIFAKFDSTNYPDNFKLFTLKKIDSKFDIINALNLLIGSITIESDVNE